ncbi:MAG TPA: NAD(P)H-hydrate dehydratase [Flavobacteriales bacterium]|nr:NAD(P)H-hydrate dehydratase [Flavobacteriales bacterium]
MKILSTAQIRACDKYTISKQQISSTELMERAATSCYDWIIQHTHPDSSYVLLIGPGNNGGDAWVIARMLLEAGKKVNAFALPAESLSDDNQINKTRFEALGGTVYELNSAALESIQAGSVLIDGIFGSGLNRPLEKSTALIISELNSISAIKIALDAPSGFFTDSPMPDKAEAFRAHHTLCFQSPRLMYLLPGSEVYTGTWHVLDIGLEMPNDEAFQQDAFNKFEYTLLPDIENLFNAPNVFAHKGTNGHALLAGASHGKTGAIVLAAHACLRSGVGLCSVYIPGEAYSILQTALPEAMVFTSEELTHLSGSFNPEAFDAIAFGPGAGKHDDTARVLKNLIQSVQTPLLIDADGLNLLAENPTWLAFLPKGTVLTPHPGELDRLCGKVTNAYDRLMNARELSRKTGAVIVLKGAFTAVCSHSGDVFFNSTGNPGMAKGGSGDVLSGIITALLARGYSPVQAARAGVFIHGLAGDIARENLGYTAMHASDIINSLPQAWKCVEKG